ncbi:MAG: thermonuclease family protein [Gemmatimonadota bacterium]
MTRHTRYALALAVFLGVGPVGAAAQEIPERPYVASSRGEVYYWVGCDAWRSLAPANLRWFATAGEAAAAGYRVSGARDCAGPSQTAGSDPIEAGVCTVERVVDGDTLVCREAAERIRLLMIDAPELDQRPVGAEAKDALERLLPPGTAAPVEIDVQERDRYGRILAYLFAPDGRMVNEILAVDGFAVALVIPPNVRHADRIRSAVEAARRAQRGLWSGSAFDCSPADHRAGRC